MDSSLNEVIEKIKDSQTDEEFDKLIQEFYLLKRRLDQRTYMNAYYSKNSEKLNSSQKERYKKKIMNESTGEKKAAAGRPRKDASTEINN